MDPNHEVSQTHGLGEIIATSRELGAALAPDEGTVAELAAGHLERVLVRGSNARIAAALVDLARELAWSASSARLAPLFR